VATGAAQRNPWNRAVTQAFRPGGAAEGRAGDAMCILTAAGRPRSASAAPAGAESRRG